MFIVPHRWHVGLNLSHLTCNWCQDALLHRLVGAMYTFAREQASHEALILRAFDSPLKPVDMIVISDPVIVSSIGGDRD